MSSSDILIIGAGCLGLATARAILLRRPELTVTVLDKEDGVARHQSGRNSGVLHTGVYYQPGSLKAQKCATGRLMMQALCDELGVPYKTCGKVIVATDDSECARLRNIARRAVVNGVRAELIGPTGLAELEPHARGVEALHVPDAGIVSFSAVAEAIANDIRARGAAIHTGQAVQSIDPNGNKYDVHTKTDRYSAGHVINCAGLYSDRIAAMTGHRPEHQIVPFRGEYFALKPENAHLCHGLIYPVPDPAFPFLGVHLTATLDGGTLCGPNALLAFAREGYTRHTVVRQDLLETLRFPGFQLLAKKHAWDGAGEFWRSFSKRAFAAELQRLVPAVRPAMLLRASAGVRAQALAKDGSLVEDFVFAGDRGVTHVCNAPSPAATASLAIAEHIADIALE